MRVVADTNTIVSGLMWYGAPRQVLDAARNSKIELFTSPVLLAELEDVLCREKFFQRLEKINRKPHDLVIGYPSLAMIVSPETISPVILADPDDDSVLACAIAADAKIIVSGDSHLLELKEYRGIQILSPKELITMI